MKLSLYFLLVALPMGCLGQQKYDAFATKKAFVKNHDCRVTRDWVDHGTRFDPGLSKVVRINNEYVTYKCVGVDEPILILYSPPPLTLNRFPDGSVLKGSVK